MTRTALNSSELNKECLSRLKAKYEEAKQLTAALSRNERYFDGRPMHVAVGYWNDAICRIISACFGEEVDAPVRFKEGFEEYMGQALKMLSRPVELFNQDLNAMVCLRAIEIEGLINQMENAVILPGAPPSNGETSDAAGSSAADERDSPLRCVILTALAVELNAVCSHLTEVSEVVHKGTVYEKGLFSASRLEWEIFAAELGAGNDSAAFELERAITRFHPAVVMFVGVAGGIKDVRVGDVVAATKVYGYESGKAEATFKPRPDVGNSSYNMVQRAKAVARKGDWTRRIIDTDTGHNPRAIPGPIAAGEKVVASTESSVYHFLRANYGDALAVEMEGRGFLEAAHANPHVSTLIVRGISDLLNNKSDLDDDARQVLASRHASAFAFEVLSQLSRESMSLSGSEGV